MKKILVVDSVGLLGYAMNSYTKVKNYEIVEVSRNKFDMANNPMNMIELFLRSVDVAINCAGIINSKLATNTLRNILKINSMFSRNLLKVSDKKEIKMFSNIGKE